MPARILALVLVVILAAPSLMMTATQASPAPTAEATHEAPLAAKGKKQKKPKVRTVRRVVTRTFAEPDPILIPPFPGDPGDTKQASPYPATIKVRGLKNGEILDVNVVLRGISHQFPDDIDVLLAAESIPGVNAKIMSDVGGSAAIGLSAVPSEDPVVVALDDQAAAFLPDNAKLTSGSFRPTDVDDGPAEQFLSPAPAPTGATTLNVFNGGDPKGEWRLFIVDDWASSRAGQFGSGWALQITAEVDVKVKKGKKGRGRR